MINESENFENIKFETISKKSFKIKDSLVFSIIFITAGGGLILWGIYLYSLGISPKPSFIIYAIFFMFLGVWALVRYIIQYQYMIHNRELSKSVEEYNKKPKLNNFNKSHYRCNGCNKNLNPISFKPPEDNLIKLFKFRGIWIKGHFCKNCVKSYFLIEVLFSLLIAFLWELITISYYLFYMQDFIFPIVMILFIIFLPITFIIIILVERINILQRYK